MEAGGDRFRGVGLAGLEGGGGEGRFLSGAVVSDGRACSSRRRAGKGHRRMGGDHS